MQSTTSLRLYFRLLFSYRTPLLFLTDRVYQGLPLDAWKEQADVFFSRQYEKDLFDCDDFAWVAKAHFSKMKVNGIGLVFGTTHGWRFWRPRHFWNVLLTDDGFYYLEPQTREIFKKRRGLRAWFVIM